MRQALLAAVLVMGCSPSVQPEDAGARDAGGTVDSGLSDAGSADAGTADAGTPDAGTTTDAGTPDAGVTWAQVQPLLWARCGSCHGLDGGVGGATYFFTHPEIIQPSTKCPGETIAVCISRALQIQEVEGTGCRTYNTPFHREGWVCLTPAEIDFVVGWVDAGAPEF
ncbi:MAG: hypothetical protein QM817_35680 [Archangium sp.]